MTTAAISPPRTRTVGRLSTGLSVRHSLRTEAAAALTLYGLYVLGRGLVVADRTQADAHARRLVALERSLHLFVESNVQRGVQTLPGLTSLLGVAYLTLHLAVTAGVRVSLGIVAAGNHFFLDAAAGALIAGLAAALAGLLTRAPATEELAAPQSADAAAEDTQFGEGLGVHNGSLVLGRG